MITLLTLVNTRKHDQKSKTGLFKKNCDQKAKIGLFKKTLACDYSAKTGLYMKIFDTFES